MGHIVADLIPYQDRLCVIIGGTIVRVSTCSASPTSPITHVVRYRGQTYTVGPETGQLDSNNLDVAGHSGPSKKWPSAGSRTTDSVAGPRTLLKDASLPSPAFPPTAVFPSTQSSTLRAVIRSTHRENRQTNSGQHAPLCGFSYNDPKRGQFLTDAANRGDIEVLRLLRSIGCALSEGDTDVTKLSFAAALNHHLAVLEYLCSEGVSLMKETTADGNSLAHIAASQNNVPLLELIYSQWTTIRSASNSSSQSTDGLAPASINNPGSSSMETTETYDTQFQDYLRLLHNNRTPSMIAGLYRHLDTLQWLREHGDSTLEFSGPHNIGAGLLHLAIENGDTSLLCWLLACGIPVEYRLEDGGTLATMAARYGRVNVLSLLREKEASLTESNYAGESPFLVASSYGHIHVLEWMHAHGYSLQDRTNLGRSAMHVAAAGGHLGVIKWLHSQGLSIHDQTYLGYTAACMAAKEGHLHVLQWLHAHGAQLCHVVVDGTTPLLQATFYGHLPVLKWLHRIGVSLADRYQDGMTVVHTAAIKGQLDILQWLASKGHSMIERTDSGMTPANLAYSHGSANVWMWLRENGLDR